MRKKTKLRKSRYTSFIICLVLAVLFTLFSVCAGKFAPYDPLETDYANMLAAPSSGHLFGTDQLPVSYTHLDVYKRQDHHLNAVCVIEMFSP